MKMETKCIHEGYKPKNGEPQVVPIVQSTTYRYDSTNDIAAVFDDPTLSLIYSRFENPTVMAVEDKIAALEGGVAGLAVASGAAAITYTLQALAKAGEHIVAQKTIYGGTSNLLAHTLPLYGIEASFVNVHDLKEV